MPRRGPGLIAGFRRRVADRTVHRMGGAETPTPPWRKRAIRKNELVKVLAGGELSVALTIAVDKVSAAAEQKIVAAGGSVK